MSAGKGRSGSCSELRKAYNECFNRWYSDKFLKGQWDKEECVNEWEAYRACIAKNVEDKNLNRLLKLESTAYSSVRDPSHPLRTEDASN